MSDVHPNVVRVVAAAKERGLEIATKRFPEGTKTAADAAAAIGVSVGQIVKSLVFGVDGEIVMALVSGSMAVPGGCIPCFSGWSGGWWCCTSGSVMPLPKVKGVCTAAKSTSPIAGA